MSFLHMFYPDEYLDSTYEIDFDLLYKKGYRGVIFDIDNTLVPHGAPADARAGSAVFASGKHWFFLLSAFKQPADTRGAVQQKYRREFYRRCP